jgi:hypothetical protein
MSLLLLFNSQVSAAAYKEFIGQLTPGSFAGELSAPIFTPSSRQRDFVGATHDIDSGGTIRASAFVGRIEELAVSGRSRPNLSGRSRGMAFIGSDKSINFEGEGNE